MEARRLNIGDLALREVRYRRGLLEPGPLVRLIPRNSYNKLNRTNIRHSEFFVQLEREARENARGLWSRETCSDDP